MNRNYLEACTRIKHALFKNTYRLANLASNTLEYINTQLYLLFRDYVLIENRLRNARRRFCLANHTIQNTPMSTL